MQAGNEMFTMKRAYEAAVRLQTDDLLTAVKISLNQEADLYHNGSLIASWLGLPMECNIERLEKLGLTAYIAAYNSYRFKYTDESRNESCYYMRKCPYVWGGVEALECVIHDYQDSPECVKFTSIQAAVDAIRKEELPTYGPGNITIVIHDDNGYKSMRI